MAIWQFDFHFVPSAIVERHFSVPPVTISDDDYDRIDWWNGFDSDAFAARSHSSLRSFAYVQDPEAFLDRLSKES